MIKFRKFNFTLPDFPTVAKAMSILQGNVEQAFKQVNDENFLGRGLLVEDIVISATGNVSIDTKLGRSVKGWIVTDDDTGIVLYKVSGSNESKGVLTLYASAAATISLWVF